MPNTEQNTVTDPRERMMIAGNKLLDAVYRLEKTLPRVNQLRAAEKDKEALGRLMAEPGAAEAVIEHLMIMGERDVAQREYITIRQTIEALTGQQ